MRQYCWLPAFKIDDPCNAIAFRADINQLFDIGGYVYVPKGGKTRLHSLSADFSAPYAQYHNSVFLTDDIPFQFLFARFAWAVFKQLDIVELNSGFDFDGKPKTADDDDNVEADGEGDSDDEETSEEGSDKQVQR
jgi:hypothetical protein